MSPMWVAGTYLCVPLLLPSRILIYREVELEMKLVPILTSVLTIRLNTCPQVTSLEPFSLSDYDFFLTMQILIYYYF